MDKIFVFLIIFFIIFLIFRWFNLWYWKVDRRADLLDKIYSRLKSIDLKLESLNNISLLNFDTLNANSMNSMNIDNSKANQTDEDIEDINDCK